MSTAMTRPAPAMAAPWMQLRPMPPQPITATVEPGSTLAVLNTAPRPVVTPQPMRAARSSGMSLRIFTSPCSWISICSAKLDRSKKWYIGLPSSRQPLRHVHRARQPIRRPVQRRLGRLVSNRRQPTLLPSARTRTPLEAIRSPDRRRGRGRRRTDRIPPREPDGTAPRRPAFWATEQLLNTCCAPSTSCSCGPAVARGRGERRDDGKRDCGTGVSPPRTGWLFWASFLPRTCL